MTSTYSDGGWRDVCVRWVRHVESCDSGGDLFLYENTERRTVAFTRNVAAWCRCESSHAAVLQTLTSPCGHAFIFILLTCCYWIGAPMEFVSSFSIGGKRTGCKWSRRIKRHCSIRITAHDVGRMRKHGKRGKRVKTNQVFMSEVFRNNHELMFTCMLCAPYVWCTICLIETENPSDLIAWQKIPIRVQGKNPDVLMRSLRKLETLS
jgi:hypothetical protein